MVVGEAVLIGAISQAVGLVVGLLLSLVLIYVINVQSFGWTIQFHLPAAFLDPGFDPDGARDGAGRHLSGAARTAASGRIRRSATR